MRRCTPLWDRFWAKVDMGAGPDACWPWMGATSKKRRGTRRGHIREAGKGSRMILAHVVALAWKSDGAFARWDPETGERLDAGHLCHNRACCNPSHLEWMTHQANVEARRAHEIAKGLAA